MNNAKRKKQWLALAIAVALALGTGGLMARNAYAEKSKVPYRSSIQVPAEFAHDDGGEKGEQRENENEQGEKEEEDGPEGSENESSEIKEQEQLTGLAKITIEQAIAAARMQQAGSVSEASIEDEDGNLVYSVLIVTPAGMRDVKIDAGNGRVLFVDSNPDDEEDED